MSNIGIIKEVDRMGRLVIPKEFRERYGISRKVEIVATEKGLLLKSQEYTLIKKNT